jgi:hypothetical protein
MKMNFVILVVFVGLVAGGCMTVVPTGYHLVPVATTAPVRVYSQPGPVVVDVPTVVPATPVYYGGAYGDGLEQQRLSDQTSLEWGRLSLQQQQEKHQYDLELRRQRQQQLQANEQYLLDAGRQAQANRQQGGVIETPQRTPSRVGPGRTVRLSSPGAEAPKALPPAPDQPVVTRQKTPSHSVNR